MYIIDLLIQSCLIQKRKDLFYKRASARWIKYCLTTINYLQSKKSEIKIKSCFYNEDDNTMIFYCRKRGGNEDYKFTVQYKRGLLALSIPANTKTYNAIYTALKYHFPIEYFSENRNKDTSLDTNIVLATGAIVNNKTIANYAYDYNQSLQTEKSYAIDENLLAYTPPPAPAAREIDRTDEEKEITKMKQREYEARVITHKKHAINLPPPALQEYKIENKKEEVTSYSKTTEFTSKRLQTKLYIYFKYIVKVWS